MISSDPKFMAPLGAGMMTLQDRLREAFEAYAECAAQRDAAQQARDRLVSEVERLRALIRRVVADWGHHDHGPHPDPEPCPADCPWPAPVAEANLPPFHPSSDQCR